MKLSTKGRYAVMAMVDLAMRDCGTTPVTLADIAKCQDISLSYLEQLFGKLRRGALVRSVRGPGGGYILARPPAHIRIADIFVAVDEPLRATRCTDEALVGCQSDRRPCATHDLWAELGNRIYQFLSAVTLEDVCARRVQDVSRRFSPGEQPDVAAE